MDHYSGLPVFTRMVRTDTDAVVRQLKRWFATFGVVRAIRSDNGPPFFGRGFREFCKVVNFPCVEVHGFGVFQPFRVSLALLLPTFNGHV